MKSKNKIGVLLFVLFAAGGVLGGTAPEIPYLNKTGDSCMGWSTDGWRIVKRSPSNYEWDAGEKDEVVDFTVFQAADGTWQLIGCVRWCTFPVPYDTKGQPKGRLLFRWESPDLLASDWKEMGVFQTTDDLPEEMKGKWTGGMIQAPYVIKDGDLYYMIFNSGGGCHLMSSSDGKAWVHQKNSAGKYKLFDNQKGRDITLVDNRDVDGKWYAVLCAKTKFAGGYKGFVKYACATNIAGPWSELKEMTTRDYWQDVESPSMVRRNGWYYLFLQDAVYAQPCITDYFDPAPHAKLHSFSRSPLRGIAPEIIQHQGKYYMATYNTMSGTAREGIEIRPLHWKPSVTTVEEAGAD